METTVLAKSDLGGAESAATWLNSLPESDVDVQGNTYRVERVLHFEVFVLNTRVNVLALVEIRR